MSNQRKPARRGRLRPRTLGPLAASALILLATGCYVSPLEKARERVPIGMTRDEAISILSQESWYHQECPNRVTIDDLFFYGSRGYDDAEVVILRSEPIHGTFIVFDMSSFESYAWHGAYQDCLQRDMFED